MKKILAALFGLLIFAVPHAALARHGHHRAELQVLAVPTCSSPPIALSAPPYQVIEPAALPEERDTTHDWQERIRQNRDRYAD